MHDNDIKILLELKKKLNSIKDQKYQLLKQIESEITETSAMIESVSTLISNKSFTTAEDLVDAETFLKMHEESSLNHLNYSRKIFSEDNILQAVLQFEEDSIFIRFPESSRIRLTQEMYITKFVKPVLIDLKKIEKNLKPELTKSVYEGIEYIDTIVLKNVLTYESFELVVEKVQLMITKIL